MWTKGGFNNAPIQFFEIQFNTSVEPDNWVFAAYANQSANTITLRLHPGVTYSFRVLATNKIGISDPSKQSDFCITNPSKPRKNPGNVRGVGDKANYLIVEWTVSLHESYKNKTYKVLHFRKNRQLTDVNLLCN